MLTEEIPKYLIPYIAQQDAAFYTPMDHASWRFILKISQAFFSDRAHQKYLDGLHQTGVSTEKIPLISDMDTCLRRLHWRAVPVSGFIPPTVFMEFLSLGVLPIACGMRKFEHLAYTPAPDIVHEAAGHAPMIADPEYADYLRCYGEISRKAIFSLQDMDVYHAIRHLSDAKEDSHSSPMDVMAAQRKLDLAVASITYESEAALLSRMAWWTFEYGMVGSLDHPKIYGAGLLSSMSESFHCLTDQVKKIPFSIECIQMSYDITRPQPQLYVAPDFQVLKKALDQLADQMAFRKGKLAGLEKATQAKTVTTVVLDSGIQVTGVVSDFYQDSSGRPDFIRWIGPVQLSYGDQEIEGQGVQHHQDGYSSPIVEVTEAQLSEAGFNVGAQGQLKLASGVVIEGILIAQLKKQDRIVLLTFDSCTVRRGDEILFKPQWGKFDVVCGQVVVSVFGGAADRDRYPIEGALPIQVSGKQKTNLTEDNQELNDLYSELRQLRELNPPEQVEGKLKLEFIEKLTPIYVQLEKRHPSDWLLRYELLEIISERQLPVSWDGNLRARLKEISIESSEKAEMIQRGLELIHAH